MRRLKKTVSLETENRIANTSKEISDHKIESTSGNSNSVTSEEVTCQIEAAIHPLTRQLKRIGELKIEPR